MKELSTQAYHEYILIKFGRDLVFDYPLGQTGSGFKKNGFVKEIYEVSRFQLL